MNRDHRAALRDRLLADVRQRPVIMGILNVTPDSFSDGGQATTPDSAVAKGRALAAAGADIIDIGGESTRPGAREVEAAEELARVLPVVSALAQAGEFALSIDTYKAEVARQATQAGAIMVNDVWGLQRDPAMADCVADAGAAVVIMHNRSAADPDLDIVADLHRFFDHSLGLAQRAGIASHHILLDPGIGFGKTQPQNLTCLARLSELRDYGLPILLGISRKSFIGHVLGKPVDQRLAASVQTNLYGILNGADVIRVHDVAEHAEALTLLAAIRGAQHG